MFLLCALSDAKYTACSVYTEYIHERSWILQTKIRKWGNSLGIRIPQQLAVAIGIAENSTVEIETDGENIRIKAARPTLKELVREITDENRHAETDWGSPKGREIW